MAAIEAQGRAKWMNDPVYHALAGALALVGFVLVITSFWKLGLSGTYLGDYFGILMEDKVTGFPFNVTDHPMYEGSTMLFCSEAIM